MNNNSMAITILCSHLCVSENIKPLEPSEWSSFADILVENDLQPHDILTYKNFNLLFSDEQSDRIKGLIDRSGSIAFEIEKLNNIGINIVTRADSKYPKNLKSKLGKTCPPLFYTAGDITLLEKSQIGFVGSRTVGERDINFTHSLVSNAVKRNYHIVSGGAKGVDTAASSQALADGGYVIEFISDSLIRKLKNTDTVNAVRNGRLLLISVAKPDAGFNAGIAMMRNRYIYASSEATVIVKSDYNKGGTWSGALDAVKKNLCPVFCYENKKHVGNMELIKKGAIPISEDWDFNLKLNDSYQQISFE